MSATWTDIKSGVAGLLDTAIDSASTPTEEQVAGWVYEATLLMCELLPDKQLTSFEKVVTATGVGQYLDLTAHNVIRVTSVRKNGKICNMIDRETMDRIEAASLTMYDINNIACCVAPQLTATTAIRFLPTTTYDVEVRVIQNPLSPATAWQSSTACVPPVTWRGLLIEYAVMKAKYQDEEVELATVAHNNWQEKVQVTLGGKTLSTRGA